MDVKGSSSRRQCSTVAADRDADPRHPGAICTGVAEICGTQPSRFCASTSPMATPNCYQAQANHQTMIETNFAANGGGCYPASMASCVWYDISLIPGACTDDAWQPNYCLPSAMPNAVASFPDNPTPLFYFFAARHPLAFGAAPQGGPPAGGSWRDLATFVVRA